MRRLKTPWKIGLIISLGALFLFIGRALAQEGIPVRADITPNGEGGNGWSYAPAISSAGRYLAFTSTADNLVEEDLNLAADVFIIDRRSNSTSLVSISTRGEQGNAWSYQPKISADGRYVVFTSLANNLAGPYQGGDSNGLADVFVRDRGTSTTQRVSIRSDGREGIGWSDQPAISGDGRFVAFVSTAEDLSEVPSSASTNVYIHDRQNRRTWSITGRPALDDGLTEAAHPAISTSGRYVAYISTSAEGERIAIHDIVSGETGYVSAAGPGPDEQGSLSKPAISADGRTVAFAKLGVASGRLFVYDPFTGKMSEHKIPGTRFGWSAHRPQVAISSNGGYISIENGEGISIFDRKSAQFEDELSSTPPAGSWEPAITEDGRHVAYTSSGEDINLFLYDRGEGIQDIPPVTGWISDGQGHPLVGVTIKTSDGLATKTDANGNFYFEKLRSGPHDISPVKNGIEFTPSAYRFTLGPNSSTSPGLAFTGLAEEIVPEARLDIGMPYSLERGCVSPFEECGGPYHGFYRGDCTDLVMDAYLEGIDFDIQSALMLDFRYNPRHYYRWHNARNSFDMYRYFSYTGQLIPPGEPYLPGDIVFFDWEADNVVDHVAIISEVSNKNQPRKLIDATGVIDDNPSGLAIELDWKTFHDQQTIGHARWTGLYSARDDGSATDVPILLVALDSTGAGLLVHDQHDRTVSASAQDIEGSRYRSTGVGEVISIDSPLSSADLYLVEITSEVDTPYSLGVQTIQGGAVNQIFAYDGNIAAGETILLPLSLAVEDGQLSFNIQAPAP